jgi:8-oxo-dGTP diphosphatase
MKEMKVNGELLIKYDIPWGGIDHWENPLDALRREIKEELWLEVTKINSSPKYFLVWESADWQIPLVLTYYEVDVENLDYTASEECREMNFFTLDEALNEDLWPMVRVNFLEVKEMFWNL